MTRSTAREIAIQLGFAAAATGEAPQDLFERFFDREHYETLAGEDALYQEYPGKPQLEYIRQLTQAIEEMFFSDRITQEEVVLFNKRHEYALSDAIGAVRETIRGIKARMSEEFWLVDLQDAYDHLGEITGETVGENLIDEIFGKFCMGK